MLRRPALLTLIYSAIFAASLTLSYSLRFDFYLPANHQAQLFVICLWAIPIKLVALRGFGHFNELLSYFGTPDLRRILGAVTCSTIVLLGVRVIAGSGIFAMPRGVIVT